MVVTEKLTMREPTFMGSMTMDHVITAKLREGVTAVIYPSQLYRVAQKKRNTYDH